MKPHLIAAALLLDIIFVSPDGHGGWVCSVPGAAPGAVAPCPEPKMFEERHYVPDKPALPDCDEADDIGCRPYLTKRPK